MEYHLTRDGKKTKLTDLGINHLKNIINLIEKKSIEGFVIKFGGGSCAEDMWYDEETYYGKKAKKELNYHYYTAELSRRKTILNV